MKILSAGSVEHHHSEELTDPKGTRFVAADAIGLRLKPPERVGSMKGRCVKLF